MAPRWHKSYWYTYSFFLLWSAAWGLKFTVPWTSPCDCEVRRWRKLSVRGEKKVTLTYTHTHTHTHTQPEPWRGNSVLFLFSFICIILFFGVLLSFSCVPVTGDDCLAPRRLLSLVSVHAALPSRGAILTVGVAVNQLKLAAPLY